MQDALTLETYFGENLKQFDEGLRVFIATKYTNMIKALEKKS